MQCPQCKDFIEGSFKRIIKDSCGHEKCRVCLLQDVEYCRQCEENGNIYLDNKNVSSENKTLFVENNHRTVITCNKVLNNVIDKEDQDIKIKGHILFNEDLKQSNEVDEQNNEATPIKNKSKSTLQKRRYTMITIPNHISIEGTPPIFICNICKSKFKTKNHVRYHKFCLGENKPYLCDVCKKSFVLKSQLQIHELIHSGNKPYACKVCGKTFREPGKLKRHMVLHTDDKPHVCDECGKNFKTLNSLKLHRVIHTGEKPFPCKYCKMRFNNSSNLKKHTLSHSDEKTHMCEQCGKKFKQKWALTVHRKCHIHKRDFVCETCDKAFKNSKDLKRHETVHLDVKIYSCGICSMSFRRKDNLGRHFRNAHPDKEPEIIKRDSKPPDKHKEAVVDNPNAINVIISSPMTKKNEEANDKATSMPRTCMNGPLKLAFKTSAFKKNYNINRDHPYDSNSREVVVKSAPKIVPTNNNIPSRTFPSEYSSPPFSVDEYYANRPHVIKNIKFKIPSSYPPENEGLLKTIMLQSKMNSEEEKKENKKRDEESKEKAELVERSSSLTNKKDEKILVNSQEVSPAVTSVIVNSSDQKNIHWRRKMTNNIS